MLSFIALHDAPDRLTLLERQRRLAGERVLSDQAAVTSEIVITPLSPHAANLACVP